MRAKCFRAISAAGFLFLAAYAVAQGSQGGFGSGGSGGGAIQGDMDQAEAQGRAPNWQLRRSLVLTPGQTVELTVEVEAGAVGVFEAAAPAFDASLAVLDPRGKVIAENDDQRPGNQNPRVMVRFAEKGTYKVVVRGYRNIAGGSFTFLSDVRKAFIMPLAQLVNLYDAFNRDNVEAIWVPVRANQPLVVTVDRVQFSVPLEGDSGQPIPASAIQTVGSQRIITPSVDGFMRMEALPVGWTLAIIRPLERARITPRQPLGLTIPAGGITVVELPEAGAGLWEATVPPEFAGSLESILVPQRASIQFVDPGYDTFRRLFLRNSPSLTFRIVNPTFEEIRPVLTARPVDQKLMPDGREAGILRMGSVTAYQIPLEIGDDLTIEAATRSFIGQLTLRNAAGAQLFQVEDAKREGRTSIRFFCYSPGNYSVFLTSTGFGGGGSYDITTRVVKPAILSKGSWQDVPAGTDRLYSFDAQAGQVVTLRAQGTGMALSVFNPSGQQIGSGQSLRDGAALTVDATVSGRFFVRVRTQAQPGRVRFVSLDD